MAAGRRAAGIRRSRATRRAPGRRSGESPASAHCPFQGPTSCRGRLDAPCRLADTTELRQMTEKGSRPPIQRQACNPASAHGPRLLPVAGVRTPRECLRRGVFYGGKTCGPGSGRQSTARPHRGQVGMFGLFLRVVIIWALLLASVWLGENRCRRHGDTLDRAVKYILICM